jgi:hypothetical protein
MSILQSLLRFVDPIQYRQIQEERRRKREALPPDVDPDEIDEPSPPPSRKQRGTLTCRVCGYSAPTQHRYCPRCLAETMEPSR